MTTQEEEISIENEIIFLESIATGDTVSNSNNPFIITANPDAEIREYQLTLFFIGDGFDGTSYTDEYNIYVRVRFDQKNFPILSESVEAVFYYTPHGLKSHGQAISEAYRILRPGGRMLILLYESGFKGAFLCNRFARFFSGFLGRYFENLDQGRYDEITNLSKSPQEWADFFSLYGVSIQKAHAGLSSFAWKVYDIQTRPLLKPLIRMFNGFPKLIRTFFKLVWMVLWFPILVIFYFLFSNEFLNVDKNNCYLFYELKK